MSKLNLIWHTNQTAKSVEEPLQAGAVLSRASINLNHAALCLLSNPEKVAMAYDAGAKVIALKACDENCTDDSLIVYDVTRTLSNGSVTIRAKDFVANALAQIGLTLSGKEKLACPASFNSRRKLLIIQVVPMEVVDDEG